VATANPGVDSDVDSGAMQGSVVSSDRTQIRSARESAPVPTDPTTQASLSGPNSQLVWAR
jgi:hypothetical protein